MSMRQCPYCGGLMNVSIDYADNAKHASKGMAWGTVIDMGLDLILGNTVSPNQSILNTANDGTWDDGRCSYKYTCTRCGASYTERR